MYFILVIAILMTLLWIDNLVVSSINARVNPYQKNEADKKFDKMNAIKRTVYVVLSALCWSAFIYF